MLCGGAKLKWLLVAGFAVIPAFATAASPSFDCESAKSDVERIICGDDELAALDLQLAKAFANALARAPAHSVTDLRQAQKTWRRGLLDCSKDPDARACTASAYRARLQDL